MVCSSCHFWYPSSHLSSVLILDELDHITTCSRSLKSLFSLSHTNSSSLRIIGIANTHTLTSSSSQLELDGISSVSTVHFSPYSPEELLEILRTRLSPVLTDPLVEKTSKQFLPTPTLTLLTKKIASQTGDVRALFEVLRGAIDIAVAGTQAKSNPLDCTIVVSPPHILSALKAYAPSSRSAAGASEVVTKVRNLGLHARLLLLSLSLACRRVEAKLPLTGSTLPKAAPLKRTTSVPLLKINVDSAQLHLYYTNLLTKGSDVFTPVSRSECVDIINMLETLGIVSSNIFAPSTPSKSGRKGFGRSGSFAGSSKSAGSTNLSFVEGVRVDEIIRGLGLEQQPGNDSKAPVDVREEELRVLWEKETREIKRQISVNGRSKDGGASGFEDMAED
jgi:cell division control protein 6